MSERTRWLAKPAVGMRPTLWRPKRTSPPISTLFLRDGDPDLLKAALGDIARAKGMTEIAQAAGLGRANLYKALSPDGNPEFATVARVLKAPGLRLSVAA
jgi:probable addiction module antidote protein